MNKGKVTFNWQLSDELHKRITGKYQKHKISLSSLENILGANLVDM